MRRAIIAILVLGIPALAWAADVTLAGPSGNVRQKGTAYGAAYVALAAPDGGLNTPVQEQGGYAKTAGCVEVACNTTGDGGILSLTVESDYELAVTNNSPVRLSNGTACVAFTSGTGVGKVVNEGSVRYWRAPAGTGNDGGVAKYECCALTAHSASAPVIVQACPR